MATVTQSEQTQRILPSVKVVDVTREGIEKGFRPRVIRGTGGTRSGGRGGSFTPTPTPTFQSDLLKQSFASQSALRGAETAFRLQEAKVSSIEKLKQTIASARPTSIQEQLATRKSFERHVSSIRAAKTIVALPNEITMPTRGQKIRGYIKQKTGISLPSGGQLGGALLKSRAGPVEALEIDPRKLSDAIVAFSETAPESLGGAAGFGAEKIGVKDFDVDVGTTPIAKKETIVFIPPKIGEVGLGTATNIYSEPQIVTMGAKDIGKTVETGARFGQFAIPYYGTALAVAYGYEGVKHATVKVPTVEQVIIDQTKELSVSERIEYLKTEEGKEYKKGVDEYVKSLESQRRMGFVQAGLAFGGLGLAGGLRGARYLRKPVVKQIIKPRQVVLEGRAVGFKIGDKVTGVKVGGVKTTEEVITLQPKWRELIGQKPKYYGIQPAKLDVTVQKFLIEGDKAISVGFEKTAGSGKTLKKQFQTEEIAVPIKVPKQPGKINRVLDISKLPKNVAYVARQMPTTAGRKIETFVGAGREYKGVGPTTQPIVIKSKPYWMHKKPKLIDKVKKLLVKEEPLGPGFAVPKKVKASRKLMQDTVILLPKRTIRTSKYQEQQFIPTRKPTLKEAPVSIPVTIVEPIGKFGPVRTYVTDSAVKIVKSAKPRAAGKVFQERTKVMIIEIPKKDVGKFSLKKGDREVFLAKKKQTQKQILLQQQKQELLVARIESVTKTPRPKPLVSQTTKSRKEIATAYAPGGAVVVPKLARGGAYYGKGTYERTDSVTAPNFLKADVKPSLTTEFTPLTQTDIMTPLVYTGTDVKDRIDFIQPGRVDEKVKTLELEVEREVEREVVVGRQGPSSKLDQPVRVKEGLREAIIPKLSPALKTKPKPRFVSPPRPKKPPFRPRPRIPIKPFIPIIPTDKPPKKKLKKKKLLDELVTPFVKRRGKFFAIGKPTTKAKAIKKGVAKLRGTLAASLQLRKKGGEAVLFAKESKGFRIGKAGAKTLVQRQRARLGRMGEIREIIASRKAGVKFI